MKKVLLAATFAAFALVSCGDDDNTTKSEITVAGKWNLVKAEYIEDGETTTEDLKPGSCDYDYYDLKGGGLKDEVYHNENDNCATENWPGTWSYNESNKYVTMIDADDDYTVVFQVVSLTATDLKVKLISDGGNTPPDGNEVFAYLKR